MRALKVPSVRRTSVSARSRSRALSPARLGTLVLGLIAFIGPLRPRSDPDSWWHLTTGELILRTGTIPDADPFSWSARGRPWMAHEWLSELLFALIDRVAGAVGLLVVAGLLVGAAFLLLYRTLHRITDNEWIVAVALAPALYLSTITWSIRPHLFSILFFVFFLDVLVSHRLGQSRRMIWSLVPATVVWANLHGAFVSGLILVAVFAGVSVLERRADAKPLVLLGGLLFLAGAATPHGFGIYAHVVHVARMSAPFIEEWQPPGLRRIYYATFTILMVTAPIALALARRRDFALLAAAIVFGLMGAAAVKNVWLAGITAGPAFAWALDRWGRVPASKPTGGTEKWVLAAVAGVIIVGGISVSAVNLMRSSEAELRGENDFPTGAVAALNTLPPGRVVNQYAWGGYLIYKAPRFPVSVDGRNDMYGQERLQDTARISYLLPGWRDYLDDNDVRYVLWPRRGTLTQALYLLPEWRVVYLDDEAVLFERRV